MFQVLPRLYCKLLITSVVNETENRIFVCFVCLLINIDSHKLWKNHT
jgi:hypothetical protein